MSKKFYLPVLALILTTGVACERKQSGGIDEANLDRSVFGDTERSRLPPRPAPR